MTPDLVFRASNVLALIGWLALLFAGRVRHVATVLCKYIIPGLLAAIYVVLILAHWSGHQGGFGSEEQVQRLFSNPWLVTAGWVHYLAFDLFPGAWQVRDAKRSGIPHLWTLPSLLLTFFFGPVGFLLYLILRLSRAATGARA